MAIFRLMVVATRTLSLVEIGAAIGLQCPSDVSLQDFVRERVLYCGQFLKVNKEGSEVDFVYQSAREFFLKMDAVDEFYVKGEEAHFEVARICLHHLQGEAFTEGPLPSLRRLGDMDDDLNEQVLEWIGGAVRDGLSLGNVWLSFGHYFEPDRSGIELSARLLRYSFLAYATLHWLKHVREASSIETVFDLEKPFFQQNHRCSVPRIPALTK
jgi:hypothetical protein